MTSDSRYEQILPHEWLFLSVFLFLLSGFCWVCWSNSEIDRASIMQEASFPVMISGAVAHPGTYIMQVGDTVGTLLAKAEPHSYAELKPISKKRRLIPEETIVIPSPPLISIEVSGAVSSPGRYLVPENCRICDLRHHISLLPNADSAFLRKRKKLQKGESIVIPYQ